VPGLDAEPGEVGGDLVSAVEEIDARFDPARTRRSQFVQEEEEALSAPLPASSSRICSMILWRSAIEIAGGNGAWA
jgi:hypothetical protein